MQIADGLTLPFDVSVAQISAVYGPGLERKLRVVV